MPSPTVLNSSARSLAEFQQDLEGEPIERDELDGNEVAYRNIRLIAAGTWTDNNSKTPTLYDETTFKNTEPDYDSQKYDGPPVNIAHDLARDGEPHEASVGGYIDPDSIRTDGEALFGDFILDRGTDAGAFADTNLKSALESDGEVGFSPSVELMPEEMVQASNHQKAEEHVKEARLTGTGLVLNPASKTVDLAHETRNRAVALSAASGEEVKTLHREPGGMSPELQDEIRAAILGRELAVEEIQDDAQAIADELDVPVDEVLEVLDPLLDMGDEEGDGVGEEDAEMEDGEEEDEDEEMDEMEDGNDDVDALQDQVANLSERLEELEDAMSDTLSAGDVEDTREELSAAREEIEDLREDKRELSQRVESLEEVGKESRTLADGDGEEFDWSEADEGIEYDPATGSMSQ